MNPLQKDGPLLKLEQVPSKVPLQLIWLEKRKTSYSWFRRIKSSNLNPGTEYQTTFKFWRVEDSAKGRLLCCVASTAMRNFQCLEMVIFSKHEEQQVFCWCIGLVFSFLQVKPPFACCYILWYNGFPSSDKSEPVFPFRSVDPGDQVSNSPSLLLCFHPSSTYLAPPGVLTLVLAAPLLCFQMKQLSASILAPRGEETKFN